MLPHACPGGAYTTIRFDIDPDHVHTGLLRSWESAASVQVAGLALYSGDTQLSTGVATHPGLPAGAGAGMHTNGTTGTKWCVCVCGTHCIGHAACVIHANLSPETQNYPLLA